MAGARFQAVWFAGALGLVGCVASTSVATSTFAAEFGCQGAQSSEIGFQRYRVTGCGLSADYDCSADTCVLDSRSASSVETPAQAGPNSAAAAPRKSRVANARKPSQPLALELRLGDALLQLNSGTGDEPTAIRFKLAYKTGDDREPSCELEWLLNGEHIDGPKAKFTRNPQISAHTLKLPDQFVDALATVRKVSIKSCERHWTLLPQQVAEIHGFIELTSDEAAWAKKSRSGAPGRLIAPASGWPAWAAAGNPPAPSKQPNALDGPTLFKLLAPSVFQVESLTTSGSAQGSAVAIAPSQVLTNCHVVEAARKSCSNARAKSG
ncbi:MAG: hypothetical protein QM756_12790 [Polyangiaceae bacterium]